MKNDNSGFDNRNAAADTANHEIFLQGYREIKIELWKKLKGPALLLSVGIIFWIYYTTPHFQSLAENNQYMVFGLEALLLLIAIVVIIPSRKCPKCNVKMRKLEPPESDYQQTRKYYCEKCRVWVDSNIRRGDD